MFSNRSVSVRAPIVPMGILKSRPTGSHQSKWNEILSCLLSIHIHRVAVTTYPMSEENILCEENLCIGREYEDLFQFLASMLQTLEIGTIRKKTGHASLHPIRHMLALDYNASCGTYT